MMLQDDLTGEDERRQEIDRNRRSGKLQRDESKEHPRRHGDPPGSRKIKPCDAKIRYPLPEDAHWAAASYMDAVCMVFHPMVAYFCVWHRAWHCGHDRFKPVSYTGAVIDVADICHLPPVLPPPTVLGMGHYYRFKRGDRIIITTRSYQGRAGTVNSAVFQRTVDEPDEYAPGYHVVLDNGAVVTVRWNQVSS